MTEPGLDLTLLRGLTRPSHDERLIAGRVRHHLDRHDGYVAFSGGKDSLVVTHLALQVEPNVPVVFFDSGLEFPETHAYLDQVSELLGTTVQTYPARPDLLQLLMANGTWDHQTATVAGPSDLRQALIDIPAAAAAADHGPGLLWGIRSAESGGRAHLHRTALRDQIRQGCSSCCSNTAQQRLHHGGTVSRRDGTTAYSPIWDWTTPQVWSYLARHHLRVNPLYERLTRLGAPPAAHRVTSIVDAHQLQAGRMVWLRRGWPALWSVLQSALPRLEETV